jgi:hypothetical protein
MSNILTYQTESGSKATLDCSNTVALLGCGKSKRSPINTTEDEEALVQTQLGVSETGPQTWQARKLYTSVYFAKKRDFGDYITQWADDAEQYRMAILSAKHYVVPHRNQLEHYNQSIKDISKSALTHSISDDLTAVDGSSIETDYDLWVRNVTISMQEWLSTLTSTLPQHKYDPHSLKVAILAGSDYTKPLKESVFEYGLSNLSVEYDNRDWITTVTPRYIFDEIQAGGNGDQMGWLNDHTPDTY